MSASFHSLRHLAAAAAFVVSLLLGTSGLAGCDKRGELREWQPSDHQPPPEVVPEGQGEGTSGEGASGAGDPTARAAAALWGMRCASCHGESGRGDGAGRPPGAAVPDLTSAAFQAQRTDAQLHDVIKNGRGMMPAFGDQLSDAGIDALVQHVRALAARE